MILSDVSNLKKKSPELIDAQCDSCGKIFSIKYINYHRNGNKDGFYTCKTCKTKKTNLEKWGVENPSQIDSVKEKKKKTLIKNWGVDHPSKSDIIKEKKRETFQDRFGVDNPFQSDDIKEKIKATNINNLGVENPSQSEDIKEKKRETLVENWGVEHPLKSSEIKKRIVNSNLKNWGVKWTLQSDKIKEKIKSTNLALFGVDNPMKSKDIRQKIVKNNIEKWGVDYYYKTDEFKEKSKETLLKNWKVESPLKSPIIKKRIEETNYKNWGNKEYINTNDFKEKSKKTLMEKWENEFIQKSEIYRKNRYKITKDVNYIEYLDDKKSLFNCDKGLDHQFKISSDNIPICTVCNPISDLKSIKEKELFKFIKSIYDGEIIQSYREGLEIDIYVPELRIGFEFNGLYYHSDKYKDKWYHLNKTKHFEERGIRIIHIWEDDWNNRCDIVKSQITNLLNKSEIKIFARKCYVSEIKDSKIATKFLKENHIQGKDYSKVKLGLFHKGDLVSVMTFNKSEGRKKMEEGGWNLSRFCNKINTNVVGGASKLLNFFIKNYDAKRIISYADQDWSKGDVYLKMGFCLLSKSNPDYKYIVDNSRIHKSRFKKSITGISESELKLLKVWDCGKIKFEMIM